MSETPPVPVFEHQFKVKVPDVVLLRLKTQAEALGFHTENALAAVGLTALSQIPANKFWEVMAMIETYKPTVSGKRRRVSNKSLQGQGF